MEISTNTVSRGGYEHTAISITLNRGAFPLQYINGKKGLVIFYGDFKFKFVGPFYTYILYTLYRTEKELIKCI